MLCDRDSDRIDISDEAGHFGKNFQAIGEHPVITIAQLHLTGCKIPQSQ